MKIEKSLVSGSMTMLILRLLEEKNCVLSYEQEVAGKIRKYYRLTAEGSKRLNEKKEEWQEYPTAVANVLAMGV